MLDLGWSELLIIGVVALIVVGPKDLPKMLRTLGQYAGRAKSIAREFQRSMDDAARQADIEELHEVKKGLDDMRSAQHKMQRDLSQSFLDSPSKSDSKKPAKKSDSKKPAAKKAGDGAAAEPAKAKAAARSDDATPEPAKASARKSARKSVRKPAEKVSEPRAEPGSVSGA
ncbi:MAG: Sec-independent protein translocase protein TatB [Thermohalobaculum sp.]